jgi:adenosine kinase
MHFPGKFADSLLPDQIHNLNVSFFIDRLEEKFGGNAGNIAYSLYLLGERSLIVASAGKDFDRYAAVLQERGLSLKGITRLEEQLTAGAYIVTDQANNQITAFHAAAMMTPSNYDFPALNPAEDLAYIGPSNLHDMNTHPLLYKEKGVRYIYDPAQQLPILSGGQILSAVHGAYLLVSNDYELQLIMNLTGRSKEELKSMTQRGIVTTFGEKGSLASDNESGEEKAVPAVPVSKVVDPTGAGDAYRAGLIKGLLSGRSLYESACLGATCSAFCIECPGTQGHSFTLNDFSIRHSRTFGSALPF